MRLSKDSFIAPVGPVRIFPLLLLLLAACHPATKETAGDAPVHTVVPVETGQVVQGQVSESIELNATSAFIRRNVVRSTAVGYISKINAQPGDQVHAGEPLFILETKEARVLGNNLFPNDPSLKFSGLIHIKASQGGFMTSINHQTGDYVQEGDSLCSIVDKNSLVFMLNVPYEWNDFIKMGGQCSISLPDGRHLTGTIYAKVAVMDIASQTQKYMVKVSGASRIPENLIAKVLLFKNASHQATLIPHAALLSNEEQNEFWVMKLISDTLAIKVKVQKGITNTDQVEILNPSLHAGDKVLISGNYGLSDTASVKIIK